MKKALALVLALVLALSLGVSAFAVDTIVLNPDKSGSSAPKEVTLVKLSAETVIRTYAGGTYYIAVEAPAGKEYKDLSVAANGAVSAKVFEFDPAKYVIKDEDGDVLTYSVVKVEGGKVTYYPEYPDMNNLSYADAVAKADWQNEGNKTTQFKVVCDQDITVIEITVDDNYSASYKEGSLKISAVEVEGKKKTNVSATFSFISDVTIFKYEEVKYAAEYEDYLLVGDTGYSDYLTAKNGYDTADLSTYNQPNAAVVSTTAFRAITGKDLVVAADAHNYVTIKEVAAGQKGVNFSWYGYDLHKNANGEVVGVEFGFYGDQKIASDFVITLDPQINYFELRELFGKKVEEEDVITYYILKDGAVLDSFTVDYMTVDYNDEIELEIEGKAGSTLGQYELVLEVPAAPSEGEENPNTGAESVIGVVAAMAVVSVAAAAAVSLKK